MDCTGDTLSALASEVETGGIKAEALFPPKCDMKQNPIFTCTCWGDEVIPGVTPQSHWTCTRGDVCLLMVMPF